MSWDGDGLGPEDMAIPEIKLIQNVGGHEAKDVGAEPGDFYCALTGEVIKGNEGFDMVIVAMQKNRTYWGRTEIVEDEPPECACLDVKAGISINGDDCSVCPHRNDAPWLLSADERRTKCLVNYNVLGINLESDLPILLRTSGISAQAAKQLYTQLSLNRALAGAWFKAKTHVSSVSKTSASGDAYAVKFGKLELLPAETHEELEIRSHQLLGTPIGLPEGREIAAQEIPEQPPQAKIPAKAEVKPPAEAKAEVKPSSAEASKPEVKEKKEEPLKPLDLEI